VGTTARLERVDPAQVQFTFATARLFLRLRTLGLSARKSVHQGVQFILRNHELSEAAIQTNQNLWKHPDSRLIQTFTAREMDVHLHTERALVV